MQSRWWSIGGAVFVIVGSGACSNRPGEIIREQEPAEPASARVPDSLARQADAETLKNALKGHLNRSGKGLTIERTAAGTSRIDLQGRFRSVHVATIDENGKKHVDCVTTNGELDEVLKKGGRR
jgi:hypothetical protein